MLCTCQEGFEDLLERELAEAGLMARERGPGWVLTLDAPLPAPSSPLLNLAFPHLLLFAPAEILGESVNALARGIFESFIGRLQGERIEAAWPCLWQAPAETVGLGRRMAAVEQAFAELLRKRFSRVAKLASADGPRSPGPGRGLFVRFTDFGRAWVARDAYANGQQRMADDPQAPSRSYLKVEEAYGLLGRAPVAGETVADLGAAPGGWSYSAAQRGARVVAIDNGPLKGGALGHPGIEHRCADAFKFGPAEGQAFDWLFSDLLEEPHVVLRQIIEPWLGRRWCRRFVVNLKFGRVDPVALLQELRAPDSPLSTGADDVRIRHLFHDREEFTVVGTVRSGGRGRQEAV